MIDFSSLGAVVSVDILILDICFLEFVEFVEWFWE